MFRTSDNETERAGSALAVVALLVSVLLVLSVSALSYQLFSLRDDTDAMADARAFYAAEAARAAAFARVVKNPGETSHESGVTALQDGDGINCAEYEFDITDLTLPMQNQRRRVCVHGYWPTQAEAQAMCQVTFYMEQDAGTWSMVAYMRDS